MPTAVAVGSPRRAFTVMAGLIAAIPAGTSGATDGRDTPGHDMGTER
jgi:hypothetical protein